MASSQPDAVAAAPANGLARGLPFLLLATVALLGIRPLADGDVWWHLKTGEYFLQHRTFPDHDPFVFTAGGSRWIIRAWLTEVTFALVFRAAGAPGLILLKAALFTLAVGLLWRLGAAARCPAPAAALALLLAALTAWPRLLERPESLSFVLAAAALALLLREDSGRATYLLVPLQVLWANVHSSFLMGLLLPWPFVIDLVGRRWRGTTALPGTAERVALRRLLLVALLLWPASALTPEGARLVLYPFHMTRMPTYAVIDEVRGLMTILQVCQGCLEEGIAFLVLAAGTLAACALQARAGRGAGPGTWLLATGAVAAPFAVYRLLPYAGLILAGVALRGLGVLASAVPAGARPRWRPVLAAWAAVLLLAFTAFHAVAGWRFPFGLGVAPATFPEGAARFIVRAKAQGPLFNSLDFGSYLLWALYPHHRVFIHPAIWDSLSDDRLVARFLRSARDPAAFDALAREYRVELLVLPSRFPSWGFVAADPRWALVYWDEVASVYARREGANAGLIAAREFRETRYTPDLSYLLGAARDPGRFAAAAGELRRAAREDPENLAARLSLAFLLKARGEDLAEALGAVGAAERRGLRDATLLTWKAEILAGLGRAGEAEAAAREALRVDPEARTARLVLAGLRARAGDRQGAARHLRHLLALPDLPPDLRRDAEALLRALAPAP
jgi:hypothetical protein